MTVFPYVKVAKVFALFKASVRNLSSTTSFSEWKWEQSLIVQIINFARYNPLSEKIGGRTYQEWMKRFFAIASRFSIDIFPLQMGDFYWFPFETFRNLWKRLLCLQRMTFLCLWKILAKSLSWSVCVLISVSKCNQQHLVMCIWIVINWLLE